MTASDVRVSRMPNPDSVDEWKSKAAEHRAAALSLCRSGKTAGQTPHHCGTSIECLLKAIIMRNSGMNRWPTIDEDRSLYTHNLAELAKRAGVQISPTGPVAASWAGILTWNRHADYDPRPMPKAIALDWVKHAFGTEGVARWLLQNFL